MTLLSLGLVILLPIFFPLATDALLCFNCSDIADADECISITECQAGQSCYINVKQTNQRSTLGCTDNKLCGVSTSGIDLIGRDISKRQTLDCHECCSKDRCNKNLCTHLKRKFLIRNILKTEQMQPGTIGNLSAESGACIDDVKIDCAFMNSFFNICKDIHRAKLICAKFCSLCSLVDGNWASWTQWSPCDVTCENGTQIRSRQCSNPPPANGGLDCVGDGTDAKKCSKQLCPIHGGWTKWSGWDACSVTCGVGIERRHRNCSNPVPDRNGHQCFGDTLDDKICLKAPCANGGWTDWGHWSTCSVTCGDGLKSRSRTCTNPSPSLNGKYCEGNSLDVTSCRKNDCSPNIVFNVKSVSKANPVSGETIVFGTTVVNEGKGYNTSTGIFTAPVSGTYSFSAQICAVKDHNTGVAVIVDGSRYASWIIYDENMYVCDSTDTVAVLHKQSKVSVISTLDYSYIYQDDFHMNTFSGYLIHQ